MNQTFSIISSSWLHSRRCALFVTVATAMVWLATIGNTRADTNTVDRALNWLAAKQQPDGSWSENTALNALPLLAFLSAGHVPNRQPASAHANTFDRGLLYLLNQQDAEGGFVRGNGYMYGHGMTTLLLAELTGMTQHDAEVRRGLEKAVQLILRAQQVEKSDFYDGGWRYHPESTDSDLSVTLWQVLALKAASDVGVDVPESAMDRAENFLRRCEHPQGGFGYQPGGLPNIPRTAGTILVFDLITPNKSPQLQHSRQWLRQALSPSGDQPFALYAAHYLAHLDLPYGARDLRTQQNADGSWDVDRSASPGEQKGGPLYATSMAILALTAQYHYLPAFLR